MKIIKLSENHRDEVIKYIIREWGEPVVSRGEAVDINGLPGFAAVEGEELTGAVLYRINNGECEIVVLFSVKQSAGAGAGLINKVVETAKNEKCSRVWLITTNDNTNAMRFYQKRGFDLKAAYINAFEITRKLKKTPPEPPVLGIDGIPVRHELEFEMII